MQYPPGRRPGIKEDKPAKIMNRCDPVKSVIEDIPDLYWDELADHPTHIAERDKYRYTSDQNGLGACAADSACNTKAACDTRQNLPLVIYNPLFLYYTTSGGSDRGSVIGDNLELARDSGCCPEEVWPRSKGFRAEPSEEAYTIARFFKLREFFYVETIQQFVSALLQGYKIHAGYSGHAISFCRYLKDRTVEYKNSWGAWGDNGFGSLSLSKIYFGYGAYAYKDSITYYDEVRGLWGNWAGGKWVECPWKPKLNQAVLGKVSADFASIQTRRKIDGLKAMSEAQASDVYRTCLAKYGLST
jgi:hypothetical protein